MMNIFNNFLGAFADTAILLPLMALLSMKVGFNPTTLFLTAGLAYLICGFVFKIPMSVQPLKSIVVAAISVGAALHEVRLSGILLGTFCLLLLFVDVAGPRHTVDKLAKKIPEAIIENIQFGLGILLIDQGVRLSSGNMQYLALVPVLLFADWRFKFSPLGLFATVSMLAAIKISNTPDTVAAAALAPVRPEIIIGLLLPQMALTIGNSVLGTALVARKYFGDPAKQVTPRNLLLSIGIGNILAGLINGLPFCHGSGGLTAHKKGGATSNMSNMIIGGFLVLLSAIGFFSNNNIHFAYPSFILTALLCTVGVHHLKLARSLWSDGAAFKKTLRIAELLTTAVIIVMTRNLLYVFAFAIVYEYLMSRNRAN